MRRTMAIALVALAPAATFADDKAPAPGHNGLTIGHDGKMWRMEGCAAYPVEAQAGGQSKPVAKALEAPAADKAGQLAENKPAKTE